MKNDCSQICICRSKRTRLPRLIVAFILLSTLFAAFSTTVYADLGPKPSVIITYEELPESIRYGTLLASGESYVCWHAVDEPIGTERGETYARAYNTFLEYAAEDEYYFWGEIFVIKDGSFSWNYYPPERFKVLLYDTDTGALYVSGETERYAFDSIYAASIQPDGKLSLSKAPYILKNILNFCARLIYTVAVEVLIAFLFGYRKKKETLLIVVVNLLTQFGLNLSLTFSDNFFAAVAWGFGFPLLELAIIIVEAIIYVRYLKSHSRKRAVLYAIAANVITLLSGILIGWMLL